jgi:hypothetical protein
VIQIAIQAFKFEVISDPLIIVLLAQLFEIHTNHYSVNILNLAYTINPV